ncbi:MAG: NAD-dependent epimerase/dehydratase family protein [Alphaproteobacteria bacterium]|nr:NAD-dependent epimerase/dehydratase family protein [Alphaproteobacteria bacterium]
MSTVLVTGGSGFVGAHVVDQLLRAGHTVRATVRSEAKAGVMRDMLTHAGTPGVERLRTVFADLMVDDGWVEACTGCDHVQHVASPLITTKVEAEVIRPAVDGNLRVLRAARDAGCQRVVLTSSCAAIYYGHPLRSEPFDETSHTDVHGGPMSAYVKSKALADEAAWDFAARDAGALEVASVHPTGIFGPAMGPDYSNSLELVRRLLQGKPPLAPNLWFGVVDVRDVADLQLRAMTAPEAAGERFIATASRAMPMLDIAKALREHLGPKASRVPTRRLPDLAVRVLALFDADLADLLPMLGKARHATSDKARRLLGWEPRPWQEAIAATADSLYALGLVDG